MTTRRRPLPYLLLVLTVVLVVGGRWALQSAGVEISLDSLEDVRAWIGTFGWWGPALFVCLVAGRTFLLLASAVVLSLGGIAFGPVAGTILGAIGLILNALVVFGFARVLGNEWVSRRGRGGFAFEQRIERAGGWVVGVITSHPAGPVTAVNLGAGLSTLTLTRFVVPVVLASPIRAALYSMLGDSVVTWGAATSGWVVLGFAAISLLPLAIPRVRAWVFGGD